MIKEKAGHIACQVRIKKTNVNEPLMKYRKVKDDVKNRLAVKHGGNCIDKISKEGYLFICLYSVRYKDGVSFIRGHSLGTRECCMPMQKRNSK
jgi:putative IMPACT (imprinted ancient) family translation regulator